MANIQIDEILLEKAKSLVIEGKYRQALHQNGTKFMHLFLEI